MAKCTNFYEELSLKPFRFGSVLVELFITIQVIFYYDTNKMMPCNYPVLLWLDQTEE